MKLRCNIIESISPKDNSIIVQFEGDAKKQEFEVLCKDFNPYQMGMRKWDTWDLWIKFESEIFTDTKTNEKSYFTHLICHKAELFYSLQPRK